MGTDGWTGRELAGTDRGKMYLCGQAAGVWTEGNCDRDENNKEDIVRR